MNLKKFQERMKERFANFDKKSGPFFLMTLLSAEVGELALALKDDEKEDIAEELSDVTFALVSIANIYDLDLSSAIEKKYSKGNLNEVIKNWVEPFLENRVKELKKID
jgi:NTP pyrophosphatase (non-canonical NTP hydrolase)